jgi:cephalosporin hydroxylase
MPNTWTLKAANRIRGDNMRALLVGQARRPRRTSSLRNTANDMRITPQYEPADMGELRLPLTLCDGCRQEIAISQPRHRCLTCDRDFCMTCEMPAGQHNGDHQVVCYPGVPLVSDGELSGAVGELMDDLREAGSADAPFARGLKPLITQLELAQGLSHEMRFKEWIRLHVSIRRLGRYADFFARKSLGGRLPRLRFASGQGERDVNRWKGVPLLKTVFEMAIYPILVFEQRPLTIIELGTWCGGSAMWFADLQRIHGIAPNVITCDIRTPSRSYEGVTFLTGDVNTPAEVFPADNLAAYPKPWLIVEDVDVNLLGILRHFHPHMQTGDYIIVEDKNAEAEIAALLVDAPGAYAVDTRFTDYFGYNQTCAADQILRRMRPAAGSRPDHVPIPG